MKKSSGKKENIEAEEPIIVEETKTIEDGKYEGEIFDVIRRKNKGFDYTDVCIILDDSKKEIRAGFPSNSKITKNSLLHKFLEKSNFDLKVGTKIFTADLKKHLLGKKVTFLIYTDEEGWPQIKRDSIKFIE